MGIAQYHDQPYVRISPTERAKGQLPPGVKEPHLYYSISSDALIVTLNENLLKRALDREAARQKAKAAGQPLPEAGKPWLGSSAGLQLDGRFIGMLGNLFREDYRNELQLHCWSNLPILTEWKRRYPDHDPVAIHEKYFRTRLVCPGGGKYVWNAEWQTMESTAYGHPGEPKKGPSAAAVERFQRPEFRTQLRGTGSAIADRIGTGRKETSEVMSRGSICRFHPESKRRAASLETHSMPESVSLADIAAARTRIAGGVAVTPCQESIQLSELCGARIFCKLEYLHRTGSFKEHGPATPCCS